MAVTPGVTLGEIWPDFHKHTARLVNQNEGLRQTLAYRPGCDHQRRECVHLERQWIGRQLRPAFERSTRQSASANRVLLGRKSKHRITPRGICPLSAHPRTGAPGHLHSSSLKHASVNVGLMEELVHRPGFEALDWFRFLGKEIPEPLDLQRPDFVLCSI